MRTIRTAIAVVALVGLGAGIAPEAHAKPGPVTTKCRVRYQGTLSAGDSFRGEARPSGTANAANGTLQHVTPDGTRVLMQVNTLLCRRDGGIVPPHGGANIADLGGSAVVFGRGRPVTLAFRIHVEDRGLEREFDGRWSDYYAISIRDQAGVETYFNADFLTSGYIELIPV